MKMIPSIKTALRLAVALAVGMKAAVTLATPYASSLTNDGASITFRLNEDADNVKIVYNGDASTNDLGAVSAGLTNVPIAVTGTYKIMVAKTGSGAVTQIGSSIPFNVPRGVSVNNNPASPHFGKVYVANAGAGTKGDGVYIYHSDLSEVFNTNRTAGYTGFATSTTASPMRLTVGPDDRVYISDWSDATGNLIVTDPDVTAFEYVLKPLETNPDTSTTGAIPVGSNNIHGSVYAAAVSGGIATGDLVLYTFDEDYQQDPAAAFAYQQNAVWEYRIGAGPLPWNNPPDRIMMVPSVPNFSQNGDIAFGPSGYVYYNQRRANAGAATDSPSLFVVDTNAANYIDPTNYGTIWPSHPGWGGYVWDSQQASRDLGSGGVDYYGEINGVAVSPDGKYIVGIHWGGYGGIGANALVIAPLSNGIPDLSQLFSYEVGGVAAGRGVAFDRANNVYMISSGLAQFRAYSLGISATAITGSDGTFQLITPSTTVSVAADTVDSYEAGPVSGQMTLTRTPEDLSGPLTVNIALSGTGSRGAANDYVLKTNGVELVGNAAIIPAGSQSLPIEIAPSDDSVPELTETVILNITPGGAYNLNLGARSATVTIVDNETPELQVASLSASMYERLASDYINVAVRRLGDTNAFLTLDVSNFEFSGTAVSNVDYTLVNLPANIDPGVVTANIRMLSPLDDSALEGAESINVTLLAGTGYTVGTNNIGSATLVDDEVPTESVLYSENFNVFDSATNWAVYYASTNPADGDYVATFSYDYAGLGIPPAPRSTVDTLGVFLTVNKFDGTPGAGALNLYPTNQNFSGNYAMRFDMYLVANSGGATTEYALFGINHDGTKTNWFRNSTPPTGIAPGWAFDGLFYGVEADAAALGDYVLYSSPTTSGNNPTALASRGASTLTGVFKSPPFAYAGAPANSSFSGTPSWTDVEISQIGNIVTLKINNTVIFSHNNTGPYASGKVMLGYADAYDSIPTGEGAVIYDNLRVISLDTIRITSINLVGNNVQVDFTWPLNDAASAFRLQSATSVTGAYADDASATITVLSPGSSYRATTTASGGTRFYRVVHK